MYLKKKAFCGRNSTCSMYYNIIPFLVQPSLPQSSFWSSPAPWYNNHHVDPSLLFGTFRHNSAPEIEIGVKIWRQRCVTFLHPAHLLFSRFVTSRWQNQQILSALSLTLSLATLALAWAKVLICLDFLPSFRIFWILFICTASGQSLR